MLVAQVYNNKSVRKRMPSLSSLKKEKISEQILHHLFIHAPEALFTASIARELARDEEFLKGLLLELEQKKLVSSISKNAQGQTYKARKRWRLTNAVYALYKSKQARSEVTRSTEAAQEHYTE